MADGSDKLKLFFARFSKGEGGTPRPPSFAQYAAYPIAELFFASFGFDLITAKCASTPLCTHTHTHSQTVVCVCVLLLRVGAFFKYFYALSHTTLPPRSAPASAHLFSTFSHFRIFTSWVQRKTLPRFSNSFAKFSMRVYKFFHAENILFFDALQSFCRNLWHLTTLENIV